MVNINNNKDNKSTATKKTAEDDVGRTWGYSMTIGQWLNFDFNQKYRCVEFYSMPIGIPRKADQEIIKISRFGALYQKKDGDLIQVRVDMPMELDEEKRILKLGHPTNYIYIEFPYAMRFNI